MFLRGRYWPTKFLELVAQILKLQYTFKKNGAQNVLAQNINVIKIPKEIRPRCQCNL